MRRDLVAEMELAYRISERRTCACVAHKTTQGLAESKSPLCVSYQSESMLCLGIPFQLLGRIN